MGGSVVGRRVLAVHVADGKLAVLDEVGADESGEARLSWRIGNGRPRAITVQIGEADSTEDHPSGRVDKYSERE